MTHGKSNHVCCKGSLAALLIGVFVTAEAPATSLALDHSHEQFCAEVQRRLVDTTLTIENVIEPDFEAFKLSKPGIEPLRTHQFLERDENGVIQSISCKTKTADHLLAVHGASALRNGLSTAGTPPPIGNCRNIQRAIVRETWASLSTAERRAATLKPSQIFLQDDSLSYTGSSWVKTPATVTNGADGRPRLRASALLAEWQDWRWKMMPASWRGNHYCHLVAPEKIRELLQGS